MIEAAVYDDGTPCALRICQFYTICHNTAQGETQQSAQQCIGLLTALKYEMQTSKPITPLANDDIDAAQWNDAIATANTTWYQADWLLAECYMYRRIIDALQSRHVFPVSSLVFVTSSPHSVALSSYDPFAEQKRASWVLSMPAIQGVSWHRWIDRLLLVTQGLRRLVWTRLALRRRRSCLKTYFRCIYRFDRRRG